MKPIDILSAAGSVASIVGLVFAIAGTMKARTTITLVGICLLLVGVIVFAYMYFTRVGPSAVPAGLLVTLEEVEIADTGEKHRVESPDATIPVFSRAEHVKIILRGSVKGVDLKSVEQAFSAYGLVRPPTTDEIWYVQRRERDTLTPAGRFELEAYLGGKGPAHAQPGQKFGVAILIADFETRDTYSNLRKIPLGRPLSPTYRFEITGDKGQQPAAPYSEPAARSPQG